VAVPGELVPLHIFEERYKTLVAYCEEHDEEFGIIWTSESGLREIGCACEIAEVLERTPDGRINLVVRATRPFRLIEPRDDRPFPAGIVEWPEDEPEEPDEEIRANALEVYGELVDRAADRDLTEEERTGLNAYAMAATIEFGPEAKQGLLDLRSENARLRLLTRLVLAATKRLDFAERAQEKARSNGKVRFR
jgi:Lon protease-like protein